jgi:hypothetical protein
LILSAIVTHHLLPIRGSGEQSVMGADTKDGKIDRAPVFTVYAIVALSAATDIYGFHRFAPTLGLPAWAGALCVIPIKLIEWHFLTFATRLFGSGALGKVIPPVPAAVWFFAASLTMLAARSTLYDILASADRASSKAADTRANLTAAFEGVKAQLELVSKPMPRPSKIVEQALGWEPLLPENCGVGYYKQ